MKADITEAIPTNAKLVIPGYTWGKVSNDPLMGALRDLHGEHDRGVHLADLYGTDESNFVDPAQYGLDPTNRTETLAAQVLHTIHTTEELRAISRGEEEGAIDIIAFSYGSLIHAAAAGAEHEQQKSQILWTPGNSQDTPKKKAVHIAPSGTLRSESMAGIMLRYGTHMLRMLPDMRTVEYRSQVAINLRPSNIPNRLREAHDLGSMHVEHNQFENINIDLSFILFGDDRVFSKDKLTEAIENTAFRENVTVLDGEGHSGPLKNPEATAAAAHTLLTGRAV